MVVPVLMTSCQVSLKPKSGPLTAQATMMPAAMKKVTGRPDARAVHLAMRVNRERDLVGLMRADAIIRSIPSMIRRFRRMLWPPVDPALVDAGREGELAVARTRIAIVALLALNPAAALVRYPAQAAASLTLVIEILFLALAVTVLQLARRHPPVPWLGFAAAALDVSFVTTYFAMAGVGASAIFTLFGI